MCGHNLAQSDLPPQLVLGSRCFWHLIHFSLQNTKYIILWVIQVFASICICRFHQKNISFLSVKAWIHFKSINQNQWHDKRCDLNRWHLVHLMISLFLAKLFQWKYFLTFNPIPANKAHSFRKFLWDFWIQKATQTVDLLNPSIIS